MGLEIGFRKPYGNMDRFIKKHLEPSTTTTTGSNDTIHYMHYVKLIEFLGTN